MTSLEAKCDNNHFAYVYMFIVLNTNCILCQEDIFYYNKLEFFCITISFLCLSDKVLF